ncbi:MAG: hypothetical protein AUI83_11655 [Armatimonadetes bacterium 13_1_40CM_3_65_7]|nr:MAG: hypothetical protein AUI83_11655 [Armatimonadetes bacterium 13_1_40CM_3_65_7]
MAVVDEDRRPPGVGVQRVAHPADVPAVAHRKQRQEADRRVLDRVDPAGEVEPLGLDPRGEAVGDHDP